MRIAFSITRGEATRIGGLVAGVILFTALTFAAKEYLAPHASHAKTYPARDEHPQEKLTVAADPYDTAEKDQIFALPYRERGLLPIYLIISNDGDSPVSLIDLKLQLVTVRREKISPANADDLRRRFARVNARSPERSRFPLPLPRKAPSGSISREGLDEIEKAPFQARAVEPQSTQAGFVFFDVSDVDHPLAGSHLYVTGVRDANGQEVIYFEIAMEKYLTYRP